jgi:hypothetical protein
VRCLVGFLEHDVEPDLLKLAFYGNRCQYAFKVVVRTSTRESPGAA